MITSEVLPAITDGAGSSILSSVGSALYLIYTIVEILVWSIFPGETSMCKPFVILQPFSTSHELNVTKTLFYNCLRGRQ